MNDALFKVILLCIPVIGAIITGFLIPLIKSKTSSEQLKKIVEWIGNAVNAAEILFNVPKSGDEKREYVINFIDRMFNSKREVITKDQIRVLLESAVKTMHDATTKS